MLELRLLALPHYQDTLEQYSSKMIKMELEFEMLRTERRSFFCTNKLWKEIQKKTQDKISASTYIKQAIIEKMIREDPKSEIYIRELLK